MRSADLAGRTVAIWGLGREGHAALDALSPVGAHLFGVDDDPAKADDPVVVRHGLEVVSASVAVERLGSSGVIVKSPGVSRYAPDIRAAVDNGTQLTSGTALWMAEHHDHVVAVTGSKGKSTTSSLTHHLLTCLGIANTFGGNIGLPLLALPDTARYVVELSSYQCSDLDQSPEIAAVTSLFPEHLTWHGDEERYYADKLNLVRHEPRAVVYNASDPLLTAKITPMLGDAHVIAVAVASGIDCDRVHYTLGGHPLFDATASPLRGRHNNGNVCVALGILQASGIDLVDRRHDIEAALRSFVPLDHRLTTIDDPKGQLLFIDDSLSTAPQAAIAALDAFPDGAVTLIVGGHDRGVDYAPLWHHIAGDNRDLLVIGIPDSGPRILSGLTESGSLRLRAAADLDEAVAIARDLTEPGGTVLLSPAAPSYGRYANYEQRSTAFKAAIARV